MPLSEETKPIPIFQTVKVLRKNHLFLTFVGLNVMKTHLAGTVEYTNCISAEG